MFATVTWQVYMAFVCVLCVTGTGFQSSSLIW